MRAPRRLALPLLLVVLALGVERAGAEEPIDPSKLVDQVRAQLDKIRTLMKENEAALIRLSSGANGEPREVDVTVPKGGAQGGSSGATDSGDAEPAPQPEAGRGAEAARLLKELLTNQPKTAGQIPQELDRLVRMIPRCQGGQGGIPSGEEPPPGSTPPEPSNPELRDGRDPQDPSQAKPTPGGKDEKPKDGGPRSPGDPESRGKNAPADEQPDGAPGSGTGGAWDVVLPPELRDAFAGGRRERVPSKYVELIHRYFRRLREKAAGDGN